jgi:rhodanese-related sulfurtransferase
MSSRVSRPPAADPTQAQEHFASLLAFETDCWDVHHAISNHKQDFILLDVRSELLFARGHIPGSVNLPHHQISEETLSIYSPERLFVVYCAGPHCNGADKAALRLAQLSRPVKKMIGGVTGWIDEGFELIQE